MRSKLTLFRPLNLLILALIMFVIRYRLMDVMDSKMLANRHDSFQFIFYILGSICIAGAGYLHNNYLDQKVDQWNNKKLVFNWSKKEVSIICIFLNVLALFLLLIFKSSSIILFGVMPILLLLLYNSYLKKVALLGNILVAFLASYQLMGLLICDLPIGDQVFWNSSIFNYILFLLGTSFMIMLSREIVKDIEDQEGDRQMNYKTLPILGGEKISKVISGILVLFSIIYFVSFIAQNEIGSWISYLLSFFILLTLLFSLFALIKSGEKQDFKEVSSLLKIAIGMAATLLIFIP